VYLALFLLKEDAQHPEPKKLIALTFVAGMLAVPLAIPLERYVKAHLGIRFRSSLLGRLLRSSSNTPWRPFSFSGEEQSMKRQTMSFI